MLIPASLFSAHCIAFNNFAAFCEKDQVDKILTSMCKFVHIPPNSTVWIPYGWVWTPFFLWPEASKPPTDPTFLIAQPVFSKAWAEEADQDGMAKCSKWVTDHYDKYEKSEQWAASSKVFKAYRL